MQDSKISTEFISLFRNLWINKGLIYEMSRREIASRYKGSVFGLGWSFFNPLLMLAVYTFVFSIVFKARWGIEGGESRLDFALMLFAGLIVHGLLSDVLVRSSDLIIQNGNYVKKVVFPLEILSVTTMATALFHACVSFLILLGATLFVRQGLSWTVLLTPIVICPFILLTIGLSWIISALGTFLRDIGQTVSILTMVMLFLAPIFYPISAIPVVYHKFILANPLTFIIQQIRSVTIFGIQPDWIGLAIYWAVGFIVFLLGYFIFQKSKNGFADVL